jgi:hypothetical protein
MHHAHRTLGVALLSLTTAACSGGDPPVVENLQITTAPVIRGQAANGSFTVSDPDGLGDMEITARIVSPVVSPVPFAEPAFSDELTEMDVAFALLLAGNAPTGPYQLGVTATDIDGMESEEAVVGFDVQ